MTIHAKYAQSFQRNILKTSKLFAKKQQKASPQHSTLPCHTLTGEIVGVFDADSLPEKEVLSKVAFYFNDKKVMALQGRTISLNEKSNVLTRVIASEEKAWFQALT